MKLTAEHRQTIRDRADCMRHDHIPEERSMGVMVLALFDDFAELQGEVDRLRTAATDKGHQSECMMGAFRSRGIALENLHCDCVLSVITTDD